MDAGIVLLLGLKERKHRANYIGTGMHGGVIYIRGEVEPYQFGKEVGIVDMEEEDYRRVEGLVEDYLKFFRGKGLTGDTY